MADAPPKPNAPPDLRTRLALGLLLLLGTLLLYAPVKDFEFINYDDGRFVYNNPHVSSGFTAEGIKWAFTSADIDYWRPLSWLSHMLDVELFGLKAGGHHVTSVIWHTANVLLLYWFVLLATKRMWPAFLVAALFGWHPVHVESVAWVAERKDVLSMFFWLGALVCHVKQHQTNDRRFALGTAACFLLGLMTKPMLVTLPFQLVLLDIWPLNRIRISEPINLKQFASDLLNSLKEKLPLIVITLFICVWTVIAQKEAGAMTISEHLGLTSRIENSLVSYARYLGSIIWPTNLTILYPYEASLPMIWILGSIVLLLAISISAIRELPRRPVLFTGWFWFIGTLVPVIGLIHVGSQALADRYLYMPAIGIYLALVFAWQPEATNRWNSVASVLVAIALTACVTTTRSQIMTWRNGITVFERAIAVTDSNWIAMNNLANNYAREDRWQEASQFFEKVVELSDPRADAYYNAGLARERLRSPREAAAFYQAAIDLDPTHYKSLINLANLLNEVKRDPAAAIPLFQRAHKIEPGEAQPAITLASLLSRAGDDRAALLVILKSLQQTPDSGYLHYNAGSLSTTTGDPAGARNHFQRAIRIAESTEDRQLYDAAQAQLNGITP